MDDIGCTKAKHNFCMQIRNPQLKGRGLIIWQTDRVDSITKYVGAHFLSCLPCSGYNITISRNYKGNLVGRKRIEWGTEDSFCKFDWPLPDEPFLWFARRVNMRMSLGGVNVIVWTVVFAHSSSHSGGVELSDQVWVRNFGSMLMRSW